LPPPWPSPPAGRASRSAGGLTSIFAGAFWPVIGLGVAFELGKLFPEREATENALADLRIAKARVDGERKAVEADLGPVHTAQQHRRSDGALFHPGGGLATRSGCSPAALAATHRGRP